jgi:diaminopimelate epimerase
MKFVKMHGCGNDYVLVDHCREIGENPGPWARRLCHRRFGVGADGLILFGPSARADARMRIFNPDGSEAEMCGNGIRCLAHLLFAKGRIAASNLVTIETPAGLKKITHEALPGGGAILEVEMGAPRFMGEEVTVAVKGKMIRGIPVSMGNPHLVIIVEGVDAFAVEEYGPALEKAPEFPEGTNVAFVEVLAPDTLKQRTWERGAGETWACGTGASAAAAAAIRRGLVQSPVTVKLKGGDLRIRWNPPDSLFMAGEAEEVFRGEMDLSVAQ